MREQYHGGRVSVHRGEDLCDCGVWYVCVYLSGDDGGTDALFYRGTAGRVSNLAGSAHGAKTGVIGRMPSMLQLCGLA
jgi:hypothetical protein